MSFVEKCVQQNLENKITNKSHREVGSKKNGNKKWNDKLVFGFCFFLVFLEYFFFALFFLQSKIAGNVRHVLSSGAQKTVKNQKKEKKRG